MNRFARWSLVAALMPLAACASNPPPAAPAAPAAPPGPPPLASADASFIQMAAQGGMAEVQMGELAQQNSKSRAIKAYGDHMIKEHTPDNDQLKQLATSKGATMPTTLSDEQQKTLDMLKGEKGSKFDHDYLAAQVEGHTAMLSTFQNEAASGTDPDLKSFASTTTPTVQEHLTEAQKLQHPMHHRMMMHHHHKTSAS